MKKETQQSHGNIGNHGGGVFASGRKWAMGAKKGIETALCQKTTGTDWKKVIANRWNRKRITKKARVGRGQETKWEIPIQISPPILFISPAFVSKLIAGDILLAIYHRFAKLHHKESEQHRIQMVNNSLKKRRNPAFSDALMA
jgi:hypothetical protein